ncbi:hypothetical protein A3860_30180 [Niastella vici]|uniref:Uncharacterized protein n=1 Tax=Niastella vici TaxID=1703345 RepID=A0A1V9FUE7_9BACT|nr:hypothetical protein A3860_30180 [Niastella vici]
MDDRIGKLINAFESNGWVYKGPVDISDWWFTEIFQLSSTWRPVNTNLYLTLLTDPQLLNKKVVWAVGISSSIPGNPGFDFVAKLTLNEISKTSLSEIVNKVNKVVLR